MKIKTVDKSYSEVMSLPVPPHRAPKKPSLLFRWLLKTTSAGDIKAANVTYRENGMERLGRGEPCLILMNHSSFIDLKMAADYFYPRPFSIVCTSDGFVGKEWLMRSLGCIPTQKFVPDITLVKDIAYALKTLKMSVLMYPEASYTFDGTATPLPESLGRLLKMLDAPVVTVMTQGAFTRDPLYNGLQLRRVNVSADISYLLSPEQIKEKTPQELNGILREVFTFDNFRWQSQNRIKVDEPFRADGLNRVLYKCPHCGSEGCMTGRASSLICGSCGAEYVMTEYGQLRAVSGEAVFTHVPDWYAWEREQVRRELLDGSYRLDIGVDIAVMVDYKAIYKVGTGRLTHTTDGFHLTGCDGQLDYIQPPLASYSLYADYFWYEIGDMICIGDKRQLFYCFPRNGGDIVAKTRMATEELYKIKKSERKSRHEAAVPHG